MSSELLTTLALMFVAVVGGVLIGYALGDRQRTDETEADRINAALWEAQGGKMKAKRTLTNLSDGGGTKLDPTDAAPPDHG